MKRRRIGFTIIEVSLFLAVTAALFVGIAAGTQNSLYQQRYNDTVQNFAEFMRSLYSQVSNVQNESTGRSDKAIYGKVAIFTHDGDKNKIRTYNLVGDLEPSETTSSSDPQCNNDGSVLARLCAVHASVTIEQSRPDGYKSYSTVGYVEDYQVRWDSRIQTTTPWTDQTFEGSGFKLWEGIILVTHSPSSGNVFTYVMQAAPEESNYLERRNQIVDIANSIESCVANGATCDRPSSFSYRDGGVWRTYLSSQFFKSEDTDFCVNPNGPGHVNWRRNVRLESDIHNASGVQVVSDEDNHCQE